MTSALSHPLVSAYLRDLELLLHGVEPGERAEVLAGVHEHLDASLAPAAADDDVRQSLAELGSPQSVADEAYAGRSPSVVVAPAPPRRPGAMSRTWVPVTAGILIGVALCLVLLAVGAGSGYSTTSISSSDSGSQGFPEEVTLFSSSPAALITGLLFSWPLWVSAAVIVGISPLWTSRQKWTLQLLTPVSAIALWALPTLGWTLTHAELGINSGAWAGLFLTIVGGGFLLLRTCRAGTRQAKALESGTL
ncbi:HAAS signaling domain-containing protein [Knoellia sp. CPCC 206453]|uniref:HAAS signaling domain-containing protein n=1 Tax=Knoellia pratensis TaxID=3404796 RepID=UPI00361A44F4